MKSLTVRVPDETYEWLRRESFEQRTSINALVLMAIAQPDTNAIWAFPADRPVDA